MFQRGVWRLISVDPPQWVCWGEQRHIHPFEDKWQVSHYVSVQPIWKWMFFTGFLSRFLTFVKNLVNHIMCFVCAVVVGNPLRPGSFLWDIKMPFEQNIYCLGVERLQTVFQESCFVIWNRLFPCHLSFSDYVLFYKGVQYVDCICCSNSASCIPSPPPPSFLMEADLALNEARAASLELWALLPLGC